MAAATVAPPFEEAPLVAAVAFEKKPATEDCPAPFAAFLGLGLMPSLSPSLSLKSGLMQVFKQKGEEEGICDRKESRVIFGKGWDHGYNECDR